MSCNYLLVIPAGNYCQSKRKLKLLLFDDIGICIESLPKDGPL